MEFHRKAGRGASRFAPRTAPGPPPCTGQALAVTDRTCYSPLAHFGGARGPGRLGQQVGDRAASHVVVERESAPHAGAPELLLPTRLEREGASDPPLRRPGSTSIASSHGPSSAHGAALRGGVERELPATCAARADPGAPPASWAVKRSAVMPNLVRDGGAPTASPTGSSRASHLARVRAARAFPARTAAVPDDARHHGVVPTRSGRENPSCDGSAIDETPSRPAS